MFTVFQILSGEIYRSLEVEIPPEKIEPIMRQGEIKIAGHLVNIEQHKKAACKKPRPRF